MNLPSNRTVSVGGVILNPGGSVLVINQNGNSWSLPKGHVEAGETLRQTAVREIAEETGITQLEFLSELGSYERFKMDKDGSDDSSELKRMTFFLFRTSQTRIQSDDPAHAEGRWVPRDQVAALLTHPKDREFFLSILDRINTYL